MPLGKLLCLVSGREHGLRSRSGAAFEDTHPLFCDFGQDATSTMSAQLDDLVAGQCAGKSHT